MTAAGHRWGRGSLAEAAKLWHNSRILMLPRLVASPGGGYLGNPGYRGEREETVKKIGEGVSWGTRPFLFYS